MQTTLSKINLYKVLNPYPGEYLTVKELVEKLLKDRIAK